MSRSTKMFIVCVVAAVHAILLRPQSSFAQTASAQISADVQAACASDVQRLCSGVQPGGGRIIACLKEHKDSLSDRCKQAAALLAGATSGSSGAAAPASDAPGRGAEPSGCGRSG